MANEIRVTLSARLENGELKDRVDQKKMEIDQTYADAYVTTIAATTEVQSPDFTELSNSVAGVMFLQNLSTAHACLYGGIAQSTLVPIFSLGPTETQFVKFNNADFSSTDIGFRTAATTDTPDIKIKAYGA